MYIYIYIYECIFRCIGRHRLLKRQWERRRRTGPSAQSGARTCTPQPAHTSANVSILQHTSAHVSIRQHTCTRQPAPPAPPLVATSNVSCPFHCPKENPDFTCDFFLEKKSKLTQREPRLLHLFCLSWSSTDKDRSLSTFTYFYI